MGAPELGQDGVRDGGRPVPVVDTELPALPPAPELGLRGGEQVDDGVGRCSPFGDPAG